MQRLLIFFVIVAILVEGSLTSLPLVLVAILLFSLQNRGNESFFLAFISGIALDVLLVRPLGQTSIFLLIVLFLITLYEKKYEVNSLFFMIAATFLTSLLYFIFFPVPGIFLQIITSILLGSILYTLSRTKKVNTQASVSHL